jgi:dienelactone hydrolase
VTGSQSLQDWVNSDAKLALGGTIGKGIKAIGKPLERGIETLLPSSWKSKFERGFENVVGGFRDTDRYKQADETLKAAKAKYQPADVSITGHSLGGRIVQDIAKKSDKVFALDPGQTIGQKVKGSQNVYRSAGDVVSLASAGSIKTLANPHVRTIIPALISGNPNKIGIAAAIDAYHAHDIGNIKGSKIFI